ncbi:hypothetical protein Hypma_011707 [Hypsizygus marmoreus]|uniref:Late embryogenesis abundant protein LEA-2 subgroup domain-containing protein n=1 Tax=Hypsizygus marmoreus TaxID=39966 RepID=A0A369JH41_HYPMA|nr:hypothetical protein Hypma_011707 [Hypsizygus marmoreus]
MAYRDPYAEQPGRLQSQPRYSESTPEYDPYSTLQPHQTYDQGGIGPSYDTYGNGYRDEPQYYPPQREQSHRTTRGAPPPLGKVDSMDPSHSKEAALETAVYPAVDTPREKRTARALRTYRYDHQGALWTKGSRGRCVGRFCCCTLLIAVLLIVCIVLALALWIRPPNITIGDVKTVAKDGSTIQLVDNGISVNLGVNISVNNPNYFAVNFKQIKAEIFYPINNTKVGEGISKDVVFHSRSLTNWTFPFAINYRTTEDPGSMILQDLALKCGVTGSKSDIKVNYEITLGLRILFIVISPVVKDSFNFACPIDPSDLDKLIKSTGLNIGGLLGGAL